MCSVFQLSVNSSRPQVLRIRELFSYVWLPSLNGKHGVHVSPIQCHLFSARQQPCHLQGIFNLPSIQRHGGQIVKVLFRETGTLRAELQKVTPYLTAGRHGKGKVFHRDVDTRLKSWVDIVGAVSRHKQDAFIEFQSPQEDGNDSVAV